MAKHQRDAAKERFWRDVIRRHAASGQSVRAFCLREKLTESAFYFWRRTIAERNGQAHRTPQSPAFVPVTVTDRTSRDPSIELELAGGRLLRFPQSISTERLVALIHALEARGER
jgi:transposase-like protein